MLPDSRIKYENDNLECLRHDTSSQSPSGLTRGSRAINAYVSAFRFGESGRSMVEILGVLAVIGVLSIGGIMGYKYAIDKSKANQIMNDVELAYVSVSAQPNRESGLMEYTEAMSGFPTFTELIKEDDFQTDIVLVKQVPESVCDKVLDITQNSDWIISGVETDTNCLYPLTECDEMNALVFSLVDVRDFSYACEKECPANMMCGIDDECICATGYETDETGNCVKKTCDLTAGPEAQPDRYCCEELGGYWNYDIEPQMCGCPEGYFFNGKACAVDNWCSYTFTVPEIVQAYESDCAYKFTIVETDGVITTTLNPISGKTCDTDTGQYCILNWANENCENSISDYTTGTTTIYGRCSPRSEYYNVCPINIDNDVKLTETKSCISDNTYCSIKWGNKSCKSISDYSSDSSQELFGVCLMRDGSGDTACPFK